VTASEGCPSMAATEIAGNQTIVLGSCNGVCGHAEAWVLDTDPDREPAPSREAFGGLLAGLLALHGEAWLRDQRGGFLCACLSVAVALDGDTLVHLAWRAQDAAAGRASRLRAD
jgi:hypothetical protein